MSKYGEIRTDFIDEEEQAVYVDAWLSPDDNEEGTVVAKIDLETKEVTYLDPDAKTDPYAQEEIQAAIHELISETSDRNTECGQKTGHARYAFKSGDYDQQICQNQYLKPAGNIPSHVSDKRLKRWGLQLIDTVTTGPFTEPEQYSEASCD